MSYKFAYSLRAGSGRNVHLVGFITRIYHDARSPECQVLQTFKQNNVLSNVEENCTKEHRHPLVSKHRVNSLCVRTVAQHKNKRP